MIYEITDKCFFSPKEKQLHKCRPLLLSSSRPSLPLLCRPPSPPTPPPPPSTSGICLSVAQLSRACEVEMSCSVSQIKMRLLGCSGWFFPLLEPGRLPARERIRHTRTKRQSYTAMAFSIYGAAPALGCYFAGKDGKEIVIQDCH